MFIKKTSHVYKGRRYVNHLLVESVATPKGPRHRVLCSLGRLAPAPQAEWLALAHRLETALTGQQPLTPDPAVEALARRIRRRPPRAGSEGSELVTVHADRVRTEAHREAGPVHVGHQFWRRLDLDTILADAGLNDRAQRLTEVMTLNRLIAPASEHAMPAWVNRTALGDLLGVDFATLEDDALYRNLDRLHPQRAPIERAIAAREQTLFTLEDTVYLYDLTSTYFEGQATLNRQAKRGYSRDKRPDCKQVLVGLVLDRDGFPKAHEVFDGNRQDRSTLDAMLTVLEARVGKPPEATVVVDRGMAFDDNLKTIKDHGYHYLVASRQPERTAWLAELEDDEGWADVVRTPSPTNPFQTKSRVEIKRKVLGDECLLLCWSEGRVAKDRAIRAKHEGRLLADLSALQARVASGRLKAPDKIHEAIGRLKERYPRVARYYAITADPATPRLTWQEDRTKKLKAEQLDGTYLMKTDRLDLSAEEIWRTYMLLTRVEAAFRAMKSPLLERPIFHHLEHRVQTHIFLCLLAYHLLVAIEKTCRDHGVHTSWETLREELATHQVTTVVLPTATGKTLTIRRAGTPDPRHREIYALLGIGEEVMKPVRRWVES